MNQLLLQQRAETLQRVLNRLSSDEPEAFQLLHDLSGLLQAAQEGELVEPVAWKSIPGARLFEDGNLGAYPELGEAYAKFKIEASGGPLPGLQKLRRQAGLDPLTGEPAIA